MNYGHLFKPFFFGILTEINDDSYRLQQPIIILQNKNQILNFSNSIDESLNNKEYEFLCTAQKNDYKNYSNSLTVTISCYYITNKY